MMTTKSINTNQDIINTIKEEILKSNSLNVDKDHVLLPFFTSDNYNHLSNEDLDQKYVIAQLQLLDECKSHLFEFYKWFNVQLKQSLGNEANTGPFDSKVLNGRVQTTIYVYVAGARVADVVYQYPEKDQEEQPYVFFVKNIKGTETAQFIESAAKQGLNDTNKSC